MFHVPEKDRYNGNPLLPQTPGKQEGAFMVRLYSSDRVKAFCVASSGYGWEHVSVHMIKEGIQKIPTWNEMCLIKDIFWDEEDCVVQYHPKKSEYVNNHPHTLHLWRPTDVELPRPLPIMIGIPNKK